MDYPTSDTEARLKDGKFTDGDVTASPVVPPSKNSAAYQNMVFDELIGVITAGGLTPSDQSVTQLITAIGNVIGDAILSNNIGFVTNGLNAKSDTDHGHSVSDIAQLRTELDEIQNRFPAQYFASGSITVGADASVSVLSLVDRVAVSWGASIMNTSIANVDPVAIMPSGDDLMVTNSVGGDSLPIHWWCWYD